MKTDDNKQVFVNGKPFFGREGEQKEFRRALSELISPEIDVDAPYIFLLYGDGGIGKSALARRYYDIAAKETDFSDKFTPIWIDWEVEQNSYAELSGSRENINAEIVFKVIFEELGKIDQSYWRSPLKEYKRFLEKRNKVWRKAVTIAESVSRDEQIKTFAASTASELITAPLLGIGNSLIKSVIDKQREKYDEPTRKAIEYIEMRLKGKLSKDEYNILIDSGRELAKHLASGMREISKKRDLLIFLDTYEIVDRADHWVRQVINNSGARVAWIISGRNDLLRDVKRDKTYFRGYGTDYASNLNSYDMRQLAKDDITAYFAAVVPERPLDDEQLEAIIEVTRGIPLAVTLAAAIWRDKRKTLEDIVGGFDEIIPAVKLAQAMSERYFLHCLDDESDKRALYAMALADGNPIVYRAMLSAQLNDGNTLDEYIGRLRRDYASVHQEEARLHDEPALFLRHHLLEQETLRSSEWLREFNEETVTALRRERERIENDYPLLEERCEDEDWLKITQMLIKHLLWIDEQDAWTEIVLRFVEGWAYKRSLQNDLIAELKCRGKYLSDRGKKWLKLLKIGTKRDRQIDISEEARLLRQMETWVGQGKLNGPDEGERKAILFLKQGGHALRKKELKYANENFLQAERNLPAQGEQLQAQLAEAMLQLASEYLWPDNRTYAVRAPEAIPIMEKVVQWLPERQRGWHVYGIALTEDGQSEAAIQPLLESIRLDSNHSSVQNSLGIVYSKLGRHDEAITAYQKAIELDHKFTIPHNGLGIVYDKLGRYDEVIAAYQKAIELDPKDASPYNCLGYFYLFHLGDTEQAILSFQESIKIDPEFSNPLAFLGTASWMKGDLEKALHHLNKAIALKPDYLRAHQRLAALYCKIGEEDNYRSHLTKTTRLVENLKSLNQQSIDDKMAFAIYEILMGDISKACEYIQEVISIAPGYKNVVKNDPLFDTVHHEPRFLALLEA